MAEHFYESVLINTKDGIQWKVYANSHPEGKIIARPKYIPDETLDLTGLKKRFILGKSVFRFHFFTGKDEFNHNFNEFKIKYPKCIYESDNHKNWFFVVPKEDISEIKDPKQGVKELMKIPEKDLDSYLKSVRGFIDLILESGVPQDKIGTNNSTLLGNYTPGKSDIDLAIYGKENGWKLIKFLENSQDPRLTWKSEEDWRKYYQDRIVSKFFSEDEYVANMVQKKDDGFYDENVFSVFVVEEPEEIWYSWEDEHEPIGVAKVVGKVDDDYNSIVRPGYYGLESSQVLEGYENVPIKRIVTWSRPFVLQAKKGDRVETIGLLEKVKTKAGEEFYQIVIGYFDTYTNDRGEKEYLKKLID